MNSSRPFDEWPEKYDQWFETPMGRLIKGYEAELILEMLRPHRGELILDAGCGTGVFTADLTQQGAKVVGLELSFPMLDRAAGKLPAGSFHGVQGDMLGLPFRDRVFDRTVSVTALEFIKNARAAVDELFRVTRPGGVIVVATLNSLSPWAERRKAAGEKGHSIFQDVIFRSPEEMLNLSEVRGTAKTAIHFQKDEGIAAAEAKEDAGRSRGLLTGAFLACRWTKPRQTGDL